jgi:hypothetical protein
VVFTNWQLTYYDSPEPDSREAYELNPHVLDNFPPELSMEKTLQRLELDEKRSRTLGVEDAFRTAVTLIHSQAMYAVAYISKRSSDKIEIDGIEFTSRVLARNLEGIERVFPYVLTIGGSLENTARLSRSIAWSFVLETVGDLALGSGLEYVQRHISKQHGLVTTSNMGPGQLDWPMDQQRELFSLLGHVRDTIGVTLTESLMMVPRKSISGIIFPTEETITSCRLCQRDKCLSRKAPFDRALGKEFGCDQEASSAKP